VSGRLEQLGAGTARPTPPYIWLFVAAVCAAAVLLLAPSAARSLALLNDTGQAQNGTFIADTLDAPTGLTATAGASITLDWTATADTYATGYRVYRGSSSGGPYSPIAEVTPRTTTSYIDTPPAGTHYYIVRAFYQNWESADSNEASATQN
jgi:hypothetical protein